MDARFSVTSSRNSVPRYRTVESWVGNQAGRYEEARIQEKLREQIDAAIREVNETTGIAPRVTRSESPKGSPVPSNREQNSPPPSVPDLPARFQAAATALRTALKDEGDMGMSRQVPDKEATKKTMFDDLKATKHTTEESDAAIFRAHPGTKVEIPSGSYIPSMILDGKFGARETYQRRDST